MPSSASPPRLEDLPDALTAQETAGVLRISTNSLYLALNRGDVPCVVIGGRKIIPKAALMRLLEVPSQQDTIEGEVGQGEDE